MLAFHSDPKIKTKYLRRVRKHAKLDQLIKGQYWQDGKGCAVGCTIHSDNHNAYEKELGIPESLAQLEDCLFERLPNALAMTWPDRFLSAIRPGANLSKVMYLWMEWVLKDILAIANLPQDVSDAISTVLNLYLMKNAGTNVTQDQWRAAADAAWAAWAAWAEKASEALLALLGAA